MNTNSSMASNGAADQEENQHDRRYYINKIIEKLDCCSSRSNLLPTATQERSMVEALGYLVSVLSSNECHLVKGISSCCLTRVSDTTWDRKRCLKEIMNELSLMERRRLYCPPADHEIPYYLLIKKYIRSIMAFYNNGPATNDLYITTGYGCVSLFRTLHYAEEVADFNQNLAALSEILLMEGVSDDFKLKSIMDIEDDSKAAIPIHGSKERSCRFYLHIFNLALVDLQCSQYAKIPPAQDEKTSYLQVLGSFAATLTGVEDKISTLHSDMLNQLLLERIDLEMRNSIRHLEKITDWILKDLSWTECWQSMKEKYIYDEDKYEGRQSYHLDKFLAEAKKAMVEQCQVSKGELPKYISRLDRCIRIADITLRHVYFCSNESIDALNELDAWEALHALTLFFECGSSVENIIVSQHSIVENPNKHVPMELQYRAISQNGLILMKNKDENVQLLRDIIDDLKRIGNSTVDLDEEELEIVQKIWGNVASSAHFFVSALAYEQKSHLMHSSDLFNDEMLRLSRSSRLQNVDNLEHENHWIDIEENASDLRDILTLYKEALVEKKFHHG